jgi:hypothetical protein
MLFGIIASYYSYKTLAKQADTLFLERKTTLQKVYNAVVPLSEQNCGSLVLFDSLATVISTQTAELKNILNFVFSTENLLFIFNYFMESEDYLYAPEDYEFQKVYIQTPFWLSLLFTKCNIGIPKVETISEMQSRRYSQSGFSIITYPLLGTSDPILRK